MDRDSSRRHDLIQFISRNLVGLSTEKAIAFLEMSVLQFHVHTTSNSTGYEFVSSSYTTDQLELLAALIRSA